MTDKLKKIEREYVLSDSTVNEYGFRLLTSGYLIEDFKKNPIGYYMHRREDGIALKWDDLHIADDKILGTPVINLSNSKGEQLLNEAENGFLNAASMGHIVVLEYSTDPKQMLEGQTGPTITKWYNKECSLVDIPGNSNSLCKLFDARENELNLSDLNIGKKSIHFLANTTHKSICELLQLGAETDEKAILGKVQSLVANSSNMEIENSLLCADKIDLQKQIDEMAMLRTKIDISALLNRALEDKKITVELRDRLAIDYGANAEGLKTLIAAMPAYISIVENLKARQQENAEIAWEWDDFERNDPAGKKLKELRANDPDKYKDLFERKFGGEV